MSYQGRSRKWAALSLCLMALGTTAVGAASGDDLDPSANSAWSTAGVGWELLSDTLQKASCEQNETSFVACVETLNEALRLSHAQLHLIADPSSFLQLIRSEGSLEMPSEAKNATELELIQSKTAERLQGLKKLFKRDPHAISFSPLLSFVRSFVAKKTEALIAALSYNKYLFYARGPYAQIQLSGPSSLSTESKKKPWKVFDSKVISKSVLLIKIHSFLDFDLCQKISDLLSSLPKEVQSIALDLRSNHGGYLFPASCVAERFFSQKTAIGSIQLLDDPAASSPVTGLELDPENRLFRSRLKMVTLIDHDTRSSAEIVAATLQRHQRSAIIGETSFGEGTVLHAYGFDPIRSLIDYDPRNLEQSPVTMILPLGLFDLGQGYTFERQGVHPDFAVAEKDFELRQIDLLGPWVESPSNSSLEKSKDEIVGSYPSLRSCVKPTSSTSPDPVMETALNVLNCLGDPNSP